MFLQKTIRKKVQVQGIGLHSGKPCSLNFVPAPANSGIHFVRADLPGRPSLPVLSANVSATSYATTLGGMGKDQFSVATIEHCVSALAALRVDNLWIELDGPEIPIVDGSALPFYQALMSVGLIEQDQPRLYWLVTQSVRIQDGDKWAAVHPYQGLRVTATISFPHPAIQTQFLDLDINEVSFGREIAFARTFGFMRDVEALRSRGLIQGGSLENAIVLDDEKVLNPEGLRAPNEFIRHKVLDALGDLVTLGAPLLGHVELHRAGHDLMQKLVRHLIASPSSCVRREMGVVLDANHSQ